MSKKVKDARVQVILECTEQKATGIPGTSRYVTTKNKKNTPERLELMKYNPILKKMTLHKEIKSDLGNKHKIINYKRKGVKLKKEKEAKK